jgi:uncharacterized protein (TIGR00369 family)
MPARSPGMESAIALASPTGQMAASLGARLQRVERGRVTLSFEVPDAFIQGAGVVQGGVVAGMLEMAMQSASRIATVAGGFASPVEALTIHFLRPAVAGSFTAKAEIARAGRTLVFTVAQLTDASGRPVATATASRTAAQT